MKLIIFYENSEIIGIFSDYEEFKKKSFYYMIDSLVCKELYKSRKQAAKSMKIKLKEFYAQGKEIKTDCAVWKREKIEENIINKNIKIETQTKNEIIIIKTNIKDYNSDIPLLKDYNLFKNLN